MGRMSMDILCMSSVGGPTVGVAFGGHLLGMGCWNGGYIRNFPLLLFGVPIVPTVLGVGGTHPSQVWYDGRPIIDH